MACRKPAGTLWSGEPRRRPGVKQRQLLRALAAHFAECRAPPGYATRGSVTLKNRPVPLVSMPGPEPRVQQFVRQYPFYAPAPGTLQPGMGNTDQPGTVRIAEAPASGGRDPLQHHRAGRYLQTVQPVLRRHVADPFQVAQQNAPGSGPRRRRWLGQHARVG